MNDLTIKQNKELSIADVRALEKLAFACLKQDGDLPEMYWSILKKPREWSFNWLGYRDNELVAFLTFFFFENDLVHVLALTHPSHRQQGCFRELYQMAKQNDLDRGSLLKFCFYCPVTNKCSLAALKSIGAEYSYSEYEMVRDSREFELFSSDTDLFLRPATVKDLDFIVKLDEEMFGGDFQEILHRYQAALSDASRRIFLVFLKEGKKEIAIGKIHLSKNIKKVVLHNIAILPEHQRQGYGKLAIKMIINQLLDNGFYELSLEVVASNQVALRVYLGCGFKVDREQAFFLGQV